MTESSLRLPTSARGWLEDLTYASAFLLGVFLRFKHILVAHDPREYINSDMQLYIELAKRMAKPGFVPGIADVTHPPATAMIFSFLYSRDPTLLLAVRYQLVITILLPIVAGALGWVAFGKTSGKLVLAVTSVYFPFIDYGGYFLSEIPMALLIALTMTLFLVAVKQKTPVAVLAWALAAGVSCSVAMSFKMVAFPAMVCFVGAYVFLFRGSGARGPAAEDGSPGSPGVPQPADRGWLTEAASRRFKILAVVGMLGGAVPLTAAMSVRCTRANDGAICLVSNKGGADFLLGHYGRIQGILWKDAVHHDAFQFGSPSAYQHGYRDLPTVTFGLTDGKANSAEAWRWIGANPGEALVLSFEHVYDLFCGALPWPGTVSGSWMQTEGSHFGFLLFVLLPCLFLLFDQIKTGGFRRFLGGAELLLLTPVAGLSASVFIATGEPRYRIPFDTLFLLVAIEFYRRYAVPRSHRAVVPEPIA